MSVPETLELYVYPFTTSHISLLSSMSSSLYCYCCCYCWLLVGYHRQKPCSEPTARTVVQFFSLNKNKKSSPLAISLVDIIMIFTVSCVHIETTGVCISILFSSFFTAFLCAKTVILWLLLLLLFFCLNLL